ncbi:YozQ family protein [Lederbergia citri]|uniref:YozQ family protein n=1 Tax=Lederbergia citri TaxID=2833580 RepID=A0A942TKL4_9BACI|nr:YozQ family protein [Lederbergia citri]MBS4197699.1 YozQ family protein [Lederbergia citri]
MEKNENKKDSLKLAGRMYDVQDYGREDTLSSGLATTHEQVSDAYMEGEIKAVIDDVSGSDNEIRREGLEEESQ